MAHTTPNPGDADALRKATQPPNPLNPHSAYQPVGALSTPAQPPTALRTGDIYVDHCPSGDDVEDAIDRWRRWEVDCNEE
jgi:hypothetical protein